MKMARKILIDAAHKEETRVAIVENNNLEDFELETVTKKELKGNIYLAKVVRVEASLQAAFIEYGGARQRQCGFPRIFHSLSLLPLYLKQMLRFSRDFSRLEFI
jgi:ribonuclease E